MEVHPTPCVSNRCVFIVLITVRTSDPACFTVALSGSVGSVAVNVMHMQVIL